MLKTFQLTGGKVTECGPESQCLAVYINPDEQEKNYLINQLSLDEHTLNSSLDPEELGRVEFEANHVAAIVKKPKRYISDDNFLFKVSSVGIFLFFDKLIVVTSEELTWEGRVFSKARLTQDLFLRIIFQFILHFEEHLRVIRKISEEIEQVINKDFSNKNLFHMFQLEKSLVYYLDAINSNNKVIEKLKNSSAKLGFSQESIEFLDDLYIEGAQCSQQTNAYSEVLSSMMDARASIINNNLNIRIKMLTLLSLCIMLPTLVVSIFSMNVPLPIPQQGTLLSFWTVLGLAALSVMGILLTWIYRKW